MKGRGVLMDPETRDMLIKFGREASTGLITSGVVVGDVIMQNQAWLLMLHEGELKSAPLVGVGIADMTLDESGMLHWRTKVRRAFEQDGQKIRTLTFDNNMEIIIDAEYK